MPWRSVAWLPASVIAMCEDDERLMLSTAAKVAKSQSGVWSGLVGAVFFGAIGVWFGFEANLHLRANLIAFIGLCVFAGSDACFSVVSWQAAERARAFLAQLEAEHARAAAQQPGIWPPSPDPENK